MIAVDLVHTCSMLYNQVDASWLMMMLLMAILLFLDVLLLLLLPPTLILPSTWCELSDVQAACMRCAPAEAGHRPQLSLWTEVGSDLTGNISLLTRHKVVHKCNMASSLWSQSSLSSRLLLGAILVLALAAQQTRALYFYLQVSGHNKPTNYLCASGGTVK